MFVRTGIQNLQIYVCLIISVPSGIIHHPECSSTLSQLFDSLINNSSFSLFHPFFLPILCSVD